MQESLKDVIQEIQSKTQFVITITIFFLAVTQNYFKIHDESKANDIFLKYSLVFAFYLIFYLLFEWRKNNICLFWLNIIRLLIIVGIGFFVFPILTMIFTEDPKFIMSWIYVAFYLISLWGIFIVPVLLMIGVAGEFFIRQILDTYIMYKKPTK